LPFSTCIKPYSHCWFPSRLARYRAILFEFSSVTFPLMLGAIRAWRMFFLAITLIEKGNNMSNETGTVKWFNDSKGFGFITPDGGGSDLFAHFQDIQSTGFKSLTENQRVSFDRGVGPKGEKASNIRPI